MIDVLNAAALRIADKDKMKKSEVLLEESLVTSKGVLKTMEGLSRIDGCDSVFKK